MHPRPNARGRTSLEPHPPLGSTQQEQLPRFRTPSQPARLDRVTLRVTSLIGHTAACQWTLATTRRPGRTNRSTKVHKALRITGHGVAEIFLRKQRLRGTPQQKFIRSRCQVLFKTQQTRKHPAHVGVENRNALRKTKCRDGPRGGSADAGQSRQLVRSTRKSPAVLCNNLLSTTVQIAGTRVIAEPTPKAHYLVLTGRRQSCDIWKPREETRVIVEDSGHLRLLQHDLGQPDFVGIPSLLPGQMVAPMLRLPSDYKFCNALFADIAHADTSWPSMAAVSTAGKAMSLEVRS